MKIFSDISEAQVTRAIMEEFTQEFLTYIQTEVIIIGGGPSGLMAARDLARDGIKVLIVERNNYIGGGFWIGGYLMNTVTLRGPAEEILDEIGCPYKEKEPGLFTTPGPYACSKLIAAACDAGAKILNMTMFDDIVLREENRVAGVVINWTPVNSLPRNITCVDPVALECKIVADATGHEAVVARSLHNRGLFSIKEHSGMWVEKSEDMVVEHTGECYPGLVCMGMATATVYGLPRMGPTFGGMLLSGRRAAEVIKEKLKKKAPAVA